MVVEHAALDPRFHDNPIVVQGLSRFYAGVALRSPSGHALGALCLTDGEPRTGFARQDRARLVQLAQISWNCAAWRSRPGHAISPPAPCLRPVPS